MIFDIKWTTHNIGGDCTDSFDVAFDEGLTVRELVEYIVQNRQDEWGSVSVARKYTNFRWHIPIAVYSNGKLESTDMLYEAVKDMKIRKIEGSGGYSLMEYMLYFNLGEDEERMYALAKDYSLQRKKEN